MRLAHFVEITGRLFMAFAVIAAAVLLDCQKECQIDHCEAVGIPIDQSLSDANTGRTLIEGDTADGGRITPSRFCNGIHCVEVATLPGESRLRNVSTTFSRSTGQLIPCFGSLQIINRSAGSVTGERQSKTIAEIEGMTIRGLTSPARQRIDDGNTRTETEVEERDRSGADAGSAGMDGFAAVSSALASIRADAEQAGTSGITRRGRLFNAVRRDRLLALGERSTFKGRTCRSGGRILQPTESACRDCAIAIQSDPGTADRVWHDANWPRSTHWFDQCSTC